MAAQEAELQGGYMVSAEGEAFFHCATLDGDDDLYDAPGLFPPHHPHRVPQQPLRVEAGGYGLFFQQDDQILPGAVPPAYPDRHVEDQLALGHVRFGWFLAEEGDLDVVVQPDVLVGCKEGQRRLRIVLHEILEDPVVVDGGRWCSRARGRARIHGDVGVFTGVHDGSLQGVQEKQPGHFIRMARGRQRRDALSYHLT